MAENSYEVDLQHFDSRVVTHRETPVLVTRVVFVPSTTGKPHAVYAAWKSRKSISADELSQIRTFDDSLEANLEPLLLTKEKKLAVANLIRKAYPVETDPADVSVMGLHLHSAGFVAWWEEASQELTLTHRLIPMGSGVVT